MNVMLGYPLSGGQLSIDGLHRLVPRMQNLLLNIELVGRWDKHSTMRFGSTAKVLLKCKLKYYRISECTVTIMIW